VSFKAAIDAGAGAPLVRACGRLFDTLTVKLHAAAERLDALPQEFGDTVPVDTTDPVALRREWLRQLRMWASYNPEDVFALKAGAAIGALALVGVLAVVSVF
jgi:hypothetical protein